MPAHPVDARRRWFGTFFLIVAGGMLIWGQTLLKPYLEGVAYLVFWLICMMFTGLAMLTALLDIRAVRRRTRDQQRDLLEDVLDKRKADSDDKTGESDSCE